MPTERWLLRSPMLPDMGTAHQEGWGIRRLEGETPRWRLCRRTVKGQHVFSCDENVYRFLVQNVKLRSAYHARALLWLRRKDRAHFDHIAYEARYVHTDLDVLLDEFNFDT